MEKLVIDKDVRFALKFKWEEDKGISQCYPHWVNFEGVKIESHWEDDDCSPFDIEFDMGSGSNKNKTFEQAFEQNKLLQGFVRWDGCMEIHEFNHHWCNRDTFAQRVVDMIYDQAKEIMGDRFEE